MGRTGASAWNIWLGAALLGATAGPTAVARAASPPVHALAMVQPGLWQVRTLGAAAPAIQRMCIVDPAALMQLRHGAMSCTRFVISDGPRAVTLHYSCPGAGWGRTSLRIVSAEELEIETQGIADKAPFAFNAEAKRTGACAAGRPTARR